MSKEDKEIVEEKKPRFKGIINTIFLVIILIVGLIFYSKYVGTKGLEVKEYRVESNILSKNFSGIKIVHFSDIYYNSTFDKNDLMELSKRINVLKPDIVVFTGDLGKKLNEDDIAYITEVLSSIEAKIGKYAIYGDHDFKLDKYEEIMTNSNFIILNNSYEEVFYKTNESMFIVGLPSSIKEKSDLNKAFEFYKDDNRKYIITLVHDGKTIKAIDDSNYEVDLILGGHSLGGLINLPIYGGIIKDKTMHKYSEEFYSKGITNIYISSGLGTSKYDYRLNNKPSFNLYRLKAQ
jgi:predicted MPP superfamily phosphohydrolase